ncbi:MAG: transglutaminase family protein [Chthoniobacterales bacterium]|nr:transglutaminase family protein [Chthoniobacterales bacterium]
MKLRISYRANYSYQKPVSLSLHTLRIFPKKDIISNYSSFLFSPPKNTNPHFRKDIFDNDIAILFFPDLLTEMCIQLDVVFETPERNPFHFLLDSRALHIPPDYTPFELQILAPYLHTNSSHPLPYPLLTEEKRPTVEALVTINRWMNSEIHYEPRQHGWPQNPLETLKLKKGSCRDIACLMADVLRRNKIASRLVSGYLWEEDRPNHQKVAQGALHAWVEAYLPGAGWIGLDPTNGVFSDHHCIPCAVGLLPEDVSPVSGNYYSPEPVHSQMNLSIQVQKLQD